MGSNNGELAQQLANITEQLGRLTSSSETSGGGGGWGAQKKSAGLAIAGISVPIKVETPLGSVKCHLALPGELAENPEALLSAIKQLVDMGVPVDIYQGGSRDNGGWNRGNGGGNGGGNWNRGGGGYGNGGGHGGYDRDRGVYGGGFQRRW